MYHDPPVIGNVLWFEATVSSQSTQKKKNPGHDGGNIGVMISSTLPRSSDHLACSPS